MENTYWNGKGKYQVASNRLRALLPDSGSVANPRKNKALERFRKASNCYYDLYNNGLCNRAAEFRKVFGIAATKYRDSKGRFGIYLLEQVELAMNAIIEDAVKEQAALLLASHNLVTLINEGAVA